MQSIILPVREAIRPASGPDLEPEPADPVADGAGAADRRTGSRRAGSAHSDGSRFGNRTLVHHWLVELRVPSG